MTDVSINIFEIFGADFLADDLSSDEVFLGQAQPHLFQYELNLFLLLHRSKRLHLLTNKKLQKKIVKIFD